MNYHALPARLPETLLALKLLQICLLPSFRSVLRRGASLLSSPPRALCKLKTESDWRPRERVESSLKHMKGVATSTPERKKTKGRIRSFLFLPRVGLGWGFWRWKGSAFTADKAWRETAATREEGSADGRKIVRCFVSKVVEIRLPC